MATTGATGGDLATSRRGAGEILGAGYFISRGLAKSGSREPYSDDPGEADRHDRGGANGIR